MWNIDLMKFKKDFSKWFISNEELQEIQDYFNQDLFQNIIKEKEQQYQKIKWILWVLWFIFIVWNIFFASLLLIPYNILFSLLMLLIISYFVAKLDISSEKSMFQIIREAVSWNLKLEESRKEEKLFSQFVEKMFDWAKFSLTDKYFDNTVQQVKEKTNMLKNYQRVEKFNNSIQKDIKENWETIANMQWVEIVTKKKKTTKTKNWTSTKTVTVDHVYLQKISLNSEEKVFDWIQIIHKKSILNKLAIFLFVIPFVLIFFITWWNMSSIEQFWIVWVLILLVVLILWWWWYFFKKWKKVNLEDIEFEKKFDIYAQDQNKVRNFLDSRTINSIKQLSQKFPNKKFDFYFEWNDIYIFIHLNKKFLDLWNYLFLNRTLKWYIEFYVLTKAILDIPHNLNIDYHI